MNFEQAYVRITDISNELERSDLSFENGIILYNEAAELVKFCKECIENAKLEFEKITAE